MNVEEMRQKYLYELLERELDDATKRAADLDEQAASAWSEVQRLEAKLVEVRGAISKYTTE